MKIVRSRLERQRGNLFLVPKLVIFTLAASLIWPCFSDATPARPAGSSAKVVRVSDYLAENNLPVFYIRIFKHDFPVPARFELIPNPKLPGVEVELRSPSGYILKTQPFSGALNPSLVGALFVGSYTEYKKSLSDHPPSASDTVQRLKCYGLSVEIRKPNAGIRAKVHQVSVLIHDDKQYLQFLGRSDTLPRKLLALYGALSDIPLGDNCMGWKSGSR